MNSRKKIYIFISISIAVLLGALTILISTQSGLNIILKTALCFIPNLKIGRISGNICNLHLHNISYTNPNIKIYADELYVSAKILSAFNKKINIDHISLKNVDIIVCFKKYPKVFQINTAKQNSYILNLLLTLPDILCSHVVLNDFNIKLGGTIISIIDFHSGFLWNKNILTIKPSYLKGLNIISSKEEIFKNIAVFLKIKDLGFKEKSFRDKLHEFFSKPFLSKIDNINFPLNLSIEEFKGEQIQFNDKNQSTINSVYLKFKSINNNLYLDLLDINSNKINIHAIGMLQMSHYWPLSIDLDSTFKMLPFHKEKLEFKIRGKLRKRLKIHMNFFSKPDKISLLAITEPVTPGLPFYVLVLSKEFSWESFNSKVFHIGNFKLIAKGKITNYTLSCHSYIREEHMPQANLKLNAKGNEQELYFNKLTVSSLEEKLEMTAYFCWKKFFNWKSELLFEEINKKKRKSVNSSLSLKGFIHSQGIFSSDDNWMVDISNCDLKANVFNTKLHIKGSFKIKNAFQWIVPNLHISLGCNNIDMKGKIEKNNINFFIMIYAPNFQDSIPCINGTVKGFLLVKGTKKFPMLLTDITANNLRWKNLFIKTFYIKSNIQYHDLINGKLNIHIENIIKPNLNISFFDLEAKGNEKKHHIKLCLEGFPVSGQFYLNGNFNRKKRNWKSKIDNIRFLTSIGIWRIHQPIILGYPDSIKAVDNSHHENNEDKKNLSSNLFNISNYEKISKKSNNFNLNTMISSLPRAIRINGILNGNINASWDKDLLIPEIKLALLGKNLKVANIINNVSFLIEKKCTVDLQADFFRNHSKLLWMINLSNNRKFNGKVYVDNVSNSRFLRGYLNIQSINLSTINTIFQVKNQSTGILNANLKISGNIHTPEIFGKVYLNEIDIDKKIFPFDIFNTSYLKMNFCGKNLILNGRIYSHNSEIKLIGDAYWKQMHNWHVKIRIKGDQVRTMIPPMINFDLSPDIIFEISPNIFLLKGRLDIPWANICLNTLPENAIDVASDEKILDEEDTKFKEIQALNIDENSHVIVYIGKNVKLNAFGLKTKLNGHVQLTYGKQGIHLNGEIYIPEGYFSAYGQNLIIRGGRLFFSGPLHQTLINIEMIQNPEEIKSSKIITGIRVNGTLNKPKLEILSNPEMSQKEAISYFLRGLRLDDNNQNDSIVITSILVNLGVIKGSHFIDKIGKILGVRNFNLNTQGIGDFSQMILSGYIFPLLHVKYEVGMFHTLATLILRCKLFPKLYLEMMSGLNQTLDFLYQFEF